MSQLQLIGVDLGHGPVMTLVQIGPHRLYCADAYELRHHLGFHDAEVMDPPYLIRTEGGGRFRKERRHMEEVAKNGMDKGFDHTIINPLLCGAVVTFCHNDQLAILLPYLNGLFNRYAVLAWKKSNPMPVANKHYQPDSEPWIHAWISGFEPQGQLRDKRRFIVARASREAKKLYQHPTIKPDAVMDKILRNVAGCTVIDPFMGTGSTGVAAIRAGKIFTGIERNPKHFATAVERITQAWRDQAA